MQASMRSACSTSSAPANVHGGHSWTLRGRRSPQPPPASRAEPRAEQEESGSPLTDSNRRPPPYHRRETSRVSFLMCPFCVRALLTIRTTISAPAVMQVRERLDGGQRQERLGYVFR